MNKYFQKVLGMLKPKVKHLGFNKKELKSVAANIADNLDLADDASDEDIDSAINDAIEDAMPYLSLSQSAAQRAISNYKKEHNIQDGNDDDDDDDANKGNQNQNPNQNPNPNNDNGDEEMPAWAKKMFDGITATNERIAKLESGNVATGRRAQLKEIVKGTEKWGERKLREFDRIASTFKNDDEFEDYLDEVREELNAVNQERADAGLKKLGPSAAEGTKNTGKGGSSEEADKPKLMSDKELGDLANMY